MTPLQRGLWKKTTVLFPNVVPSQEASTNAGERSPLPVTQPTEFPRRNYDFGRLLPDLMLEAFRNPKEWDSRLGDLSFQI